MKIYLAGPDVFLPDPIARGQALKAICAKYGAEGLFPLDNELETTDPHSATFADAIRSANMALIHSCDGILANMTPFRGSSMDVGTAYEMGAAAALGKPVVGYSTNLKSYLDKVQETHTVKRAEDGHLRDEEGNSVEEFYGEGKKGLVDNLMIACGVEGLFGSEEEALGCLVEILEKKKGK